ncbi:MAG TPA: hypothetical protein VMT54_08630 [Candidatus Cybelea sp.]|nr:hypothetical protein [Candidatus Cybelea sp.]
MAEIRREIPRGAGVTEVKPGSFSLKRDALLHFHEDPTGLFADLKIDREWQRFPVNHSRETATFLKAWRRLMTDH